jgi:hypothetical protein
MIKKEENIENDCCSKVYSPKCHCHHSGHADAIYGLGVVGALFYFLQSASGLSEVLLGIGKSIFWPAILMFKLLTYLQM